VDAVFVALVLHSTPVRFVDFSVCSIPLNNNVGKVLAKARRETRLTARLKTGGLRRVYSVKKHLPQAAGLAFVPAGKNSLTSAAIVDSRRALRYTPTQRQAYGGAASCECVYVIR
jgi:hypothetical protein